MPKPPKTIILRARVDQPLYDALICSARAAGMPVADLVRNTLRTSHDRRARVAFSLGLPRDVSDADLFAKLQHELITLTPIEQRTAREITDVGHALGFAAARAANKRRNTKPAHSPATKPTPSPRTAPPKQRASAAPAKPKTRSTAKAPKTITSAHVDQLRALASELGVSTQQLISHALDRIGPYGKYTKGIDVRVATAVDQVLGLRGGRS